jgi:HEAT repeat protein
VEVALALWRTEAYTPAVEALIDVLLSAPFWGDRVDAARALREVKTPESEAALWKAIADPEDLVRNHAAESLLELHDISVEDADPNSLAIRVMSDDVRERESAVTELRELLKQGK